MQLSGERRALATIVFAFWGLLYFVVGWLDQAPGWQAANYAMAGFYGLSLFGIVAGYFWARWFAMGVAISGFITGMVGLYQMGPEQLILFIAGSHLMAAVMLMGEGMAQAYERKTEWRKKLHLDDEAVVRLGKSVTRASVLLPYFAMYMLAPQPETDSLQVAGIVGILCAMATVAGLIQSRTWGLLAAGGALVSAVASAAFAPSTFGILGATGAAMIAASVLAPWVVPAFAARNNAR